MIEGSLSMVLFVVFFLFPMPVFSGYAVEGFCYPDGPTATVALHSYRSDSNSSSLCPHFWDSTNLHAFTQNATCSTTNSVTTCSCKPQPSIPVHLSWCSDPNKPLAILLPTDVLSVLNGYGIGSTSLLYVFSWGFGVILLAWSIGYAINIAIKIIRKI